MDLNQFLTPERIEQIKGVVGTFIAMGGYDIVTGALPNNKIKRLSLLLDWGERVLMTAANFLTGTAKVVQSIQKYGDE